MMKTVVRAGVAPIPPQPLSANELSTFRSFVVGDLAFSGGSENALISVEETSEKEKEEKEKEAGDEKEGEGKIKTFGEMTSEDKQEMEKRMDMEDERREKRGLRPIPRTAEAIEQFRADFMAGGMEVLDQQQLGGMESAQALGILPGGVGFNDMDIDVDSLQSFESGVIEQFGTDADFQEIFSFFSDSDLESCSK